MNARWGQVCMVIGAAALLACGAYVGERNATPGPRTLRVGGASITLTGAEGPLPEETMTAWVRRCANIVTEYYGGRFPVPVLSVDVRERGRRRIGWGYHHGGRTVRVRVGAATTRRDLERDQVLLHEMLHTGFPSLDRRYRWMREGLSTYLETALRARAGILTEQEVWTRWIERMPAGLNGQTLGPLDRRHGWGSVYWGGTIWWLLVDIELRARTGGDKTLRDVVRGAIARRGDARRVWPMARVLAVADATTGTTVASDIYARYASADGDVDLDALWAELGVRQDDRGVIHFDDDAPRAAVRQSLYQRVGPPPLQLP